MTLFELAAKITLDDSEYEKGIKGALGTADKFTKKLDGGINKLLKIGAVAGGSAVAAVTAFGKASVQTGMQFDAAMSQVAATMGVTTDEIGELRVFAQEMGAATAFSANQAAEALNYMALAGYDAETSMGMLPNVLNLAAAGAMDLGRASDMLTDSQSALGLSLDETNDLVDKMAQAASKSNTSVSQLGDAILTVGGTAKNLSGGTTELATALGVLADNGVKGTEGGTALRNIILALSAPTDTAAKAMKELGVDAFDAEGNMRGLNEIFGDLNESLSTMTQQDRMDALSTIFNNRDLKSAEALLANYGSRWDELSGYIDDASGAAQKMAETQLDNLNGDITLMQSALEGAKISLSDGLTPALRDTVQTVTKALSKSTTQKYLKDIGEQIGKVITAMTKWSANALPRVIKLFENGAPKVKAFGISVGAIVIAVKAAVNPIGALASAIGLLTGGMALAALGADDASKKFSTLSDEQYENAHAIQDAIDAYDEMKSTRRDQITGIKDETDKTKALWSELQTLVGANGEVDEANRSRVEYITGELNTALGTELELDGNILKNYQDQAAAIDTLIQKRQAERMIAAGEQSAESAKTGRKEQETRIYDLDKDIAEYESLIAQYEADQEAHLAWVEEHGQANFNAVLAQANSEAEQQLPGLRDALSQAQADRQTALELEQAYIADEQMYLDAQRAFMEGHYDEVARIYENDILNRWKHLNETKTLSAEELSQLADDAGKAGAAWQRYYENYMAGVDGYTKEGLDKAKKTYDELSQVYQDAVDEASAKGSESSESYSDGMADGEGNAEAAGAALVDAAIKGMDSRSVALISKASALGAAAGASFNTRQSGVTPTSHATGFAYVPRDNYPALLHRGEEILTRTQARERREGNDSDRSTVAPVINIYGATRADIDWIKEELEREWGA